MRSLPVILILVAAAAAPLPVRAVPLWQFNVPVGENFDTLAASGTSDLLPAGWSIREIGSAANATYAAGTGSSSTGNTYSFGRSGEPERALGSLRSASLASVLGVRVTNETGAVLAGLDLSYVGEQWRLGAVGRVDRLDFAYSLDATDLGSGTWIDVDALDWVAPLTSGTIGARDGNLPDHRATVAYTFSGLNLAPGAGLMLRWSDFDAAGADDGLAIDEVTLTARAAPQSRVPDTLPPGFGALVLAGLLAIAATSRGIGN